MFLIWAWLFMSFVVGHVVPVGVISVFEVNTLVGRNDDKGNIEGLPELKKLMLRDDNEPVLLLKRP